MPKGRKCLTLNRFGSRRNNRDESALPDRSRPLVSGAMLPSHLTHHCVRAFLTSYRIDTAFTVSVYALCLMQGDRLRQTLCRKISEVSRETFFPRKGLGTFEPTCYD